MMERCDCRMASSLVEFTLRKATGGNVMCCAKRDACEELRQLIRYLSAAIEMHAYPRYAEPRCVEERLVSLTLMDPMTHLVDVLQR
jgi:hypothetical protein